MLMMMMMVVGQVTAFQLRLIINVIIVVISIVVVLIVRLDVDGCLIRHCLAQWMVIVLLFHQAIDAEV